MKKLFICFFTIISTQLTLEEKLNAQNMSKDQTLDARQQAIVTISAFTAEADTVHLVYRLLDSTTLVISDITAVPAIEIKFRRDN